MKRQMSLGVLAIIGLVLFWGGGRAASSEQAEERKQALIVGYPNPAIQIGGSGAPYRGIIYVSVYPAGASLVTKNGTGPITTAELTPSQRAVWQLPLGEYEVWFAMRTGSEMKTFIVRNVILRPEGASSLIVEMNADAKTTIIGGDRSVQEMEGDIRRLLKEVADLKQETGELKKKIGP